MSKGQKPKLAIEQIAAWLATQHENEVEELLPLSGGFWSSAYAYRVGDEGYVLRLSTAMGEGFAIDEAAMQFAAVGIPVPEVVAIGEALGFHYAISRRHYGRFLETIALHESEAVGNALAALLQAMRRAKPAQSSQVVWYAPPTAEPLTWHGWLLGGLPDKTHSAADSPRAKLAADPRLGPLLKTSESRIVELLPACPERRDLIHGDLLHQNVLVSDNAKEITAVFSWKCSALGDFLYDVAWCTLWGRWFPAIGQIDLWRRTLNAPDLSAADLVDAPLRHHCYELQIAASHLGWFAWTGEDHQLFKLAEVMAHLLERGPLALR